MHGSWTVVVAAALLCGCSEKQGPVLVPVSGRIIVDGQPGTDLVVAFEPVVADEKAPRVESMGTTDAQGAFTLATVPQKKTGAVVGPHRVRVMNRGQYELASRGQAQNDRAAMQTAVEERRRANGLPARYNMRTELTFTVPPEGTTHANFELTTEKPGIVPVSGRVTVDGRPGTNLFVLFEPIQADDPATTCVSIGRTDAQGVFSLVTVPDNEHGAVAGEHRVRITRHGPQGRAAAQEAPEDDEAMLRDALAGVKRKPVLAQLPARYNLQTELTFTVPEKGTDSANFDLTTK